MKMYSSMSICVFYTAAELHELMNHDFKLPHDILCRRAAHDNRRAAGAVYIIRNQCLLSSLNPQDIIRPGGEAF